MNILNKGIAVLLVAVLALTGCGGGGDSTPPATTLSGTAAVGFPIVGGTVNVTCAAGAAITGIPNTSATGAWSATLSGQTLPCAVQVSGGTINNVANTTTYQSIANAYGTVNVTPLTSLIVANLAGSIAALTPAQLAATNQTQITAALGNLRTALGLTALNTINPITLAFNPTSGVVMDDILTALANAIKTSATTYANLLNLAGATAGTAFTTPAGFNTALATAYANTSSGGSGGGTGALTCSTAHYTAGAVHLPTSTELATFAKTYNGKTGTFGTSGFTSNGGNATFVLTGAGALTYNGAAQTVNSICKDNSLAMIYIEFGGTGSVDMFANGHFTGNLPNLTGFQSDASIACQTSGGTFDPFTGACLGGGTTPTITGFSPTTGAVGTTVTITGTNLGVGFSPAPIVKFGTTAVTTPLTFSGQTSISFAVPAGLAAGAYPITIGGATGTPMSVGTFTVTAAGGGAGGGSIGTTWSAPFAVTGVSGYPSWINNLFVVVGTKVAKSADGVTWTVTTPTAPCTSFNSVAWSPTLARYTAIGWNFNFTTLAYSPCIATSSDLATWTTQAIPAGTSFSTMAMGNVVWAGTRFVAMFGGQFISSADGINWSTPSVAIPNLGIKSNLLWDGTKILTYAQDRTTFPPVGKIMTSLDNGLTWSVSPKIAAFAGDAVTSLTFGGGNYVALSSFGNVYTSTDTVTWVAQTAIQPTPSSWSDFTPGAVWTGSNFIAAGNIYGPTWNGTATYTSTNGATWTPATWTGTGIAQGMLRGIAASPTKAVVITDMGQMFTSP